ncbi:hypothetical protein HYS93_02935 [Candidatus Daviesbacteria bacterium]|nr:hypothetical protein [Candidatus Daviesbacteria bacterium]
MSNVEDLYIEKDKVNAPFLLAASFNGLIKFKGSYSNGSVLYWQFTPKDKVLSLLDQLQTKTEPHIPAKDLFEAIGAFWKQVAKARNEGIKEYGEPR